MYVGGSKHVGRYQAPVECGMIGGAAWMYAGTVPRRVPLILHSLPLCVSIPMLHTIVRSKNYFVPIYDKETLPPLRQIAYTTFLTCLN